VSENSFSVRSELDYNGKCVPRREETWRILKSYQLREFSFTINGFLEHNSSKSEKNPTQSILTSTKDSLAPPCSKPFSKNLFESNLCLPRRAQFFCDIPIHNRRRRRCAGSLRKREEKKFHSQRSREENERSTKEFSFVK
jgi:hypothetical protein